MCLQLLYDLEVIVLRINGKDASAEVIAFVLEVLDPFMVYGISVSLIYVDEKIVFVLLPELHEERFQLLLCSSVYYTCLVDKELGGAASRLLVLFLFLLLPVALVLGVTHGYILLEGSEIVTSGEIGSDHIANEVYVIVSEYVYSLSRGGHPV